MKEIVVNTLVSMGNFREPPELPPILKYPLKLQKLSIYTPELSIALDLDPSVQIRAQIFLKRPKYP
jgi:hypothetical protein